MFEDIMTLAEAADELGVAPVTLRAQAGRGVLRARLVGKTWITTRQEVERYRRDHLGQLGRRPAVGRDPGLTKSRVDVVQRRR